MERKSLASKLLMQALCLNDSVVGQPELSVFAGKLRIRRSLEGVLHNRDANFIPKFKRLEYPGQDALLKTEKAAKRAENGIDIAAGNRVFGRDGEDRKSVV